jgi:hypothetical protein
MEWSIVLRHEFDLYLNEMIVKGACSKCNSLAVIKVYFNCNHDTQELHFKDLRYSPGELGSLCVMFDCKLGHSFIDGYETQVSHEQYNKCLQFRKT